MKIQIDYRFVPDTQPYHFASTKLLEKEVMVCGDDWEECKTKIIARTKEILAKAVTPVPPPEVVEIEDPLSGLLETDRASLSGALKP